MERLSSSKKVGYGFGNLGFSAVSQTISTLLMFFGTSVAGIPGTLVGLQITLAIVELEDENDSFLSQVFLWR